MGLGADFGTGMYELNQVLADMASDEEEEVAGTSTLGSGSDHPEMGESKLEMEAMHNLVLDPDIGIGEGLAQVGHVALVPFVEGIASVDLAALVLSSLLVLMPRVLLTLGTCPSPA